MGCCLRWSVPYSILFCFDQKSFKCSKIRFKRTEVYKDKIHFKKDHLVSKLSHFVKSRTKGKYFINLHIDASEIITITKAILILITTNN